MARSKKRVKKAIASNLGYGKAAFGSNYSSLGSGNLPRDQLSGLSICHSSLPWEAD